MVFLTFLISQHQIVGFILRFELSLDLSAGWCSRFLENVAGGIFPQRARVRVRARARSFKAEKTACKACEFRKKIPENGI